MSALPLPIDLIMLPSTRTSAGMSSSLVPVPVDNGPLDIVVEQAGNADVARLTWQRGCSDEDIAKIHAGNMLRLFRRAWK